MAVQGTSSANELVTAQKYNHSGWTFETRTNLLPPPTPHPNSERQRLYGESVWAHQQQLPYDFVLPEVVLDGDFIITNPDSGVTFSFSPFEALLACDPSGRNYYSAYTGSISVDRAVLRSVLSRRRLIEPPAGFAKPVPTTQGIPIEKLTRRDHEIKFFDELTLYHHIDESSRATLTLKVRVMPDNWLVLVRMFSIDSSGVRLHDTRLYGEFGSSIVLRDYSLRQGTVSDLHQRVSSGRPFTASIGRDVLESPQYYLQPEQVYDALSPSEQACDVIVASLS